MSYKKCVIKYSYYYAIKYSCHEAQRTWRYILIMTWTVYHHYKFDTFTTRYMYRHVYLLAMAGQNIAAAIFCQSKKLFGFFSIDNHHHRFYFVLYFIYWHDNHLQLHEIKEFRTSGVPVCDLYVVCHWKPVLYICFIEQMFICWKKVQFKVDQFIHFLFSFVKMYRNCKYMHMCIICIQKECSFS